MSHHLSLSISTLSWAFQQSFWTDCFSFDLFSTIAISLEYFSERWWKSRRTKIEELLGLHDVYFSLQLTTIEVSLHLFHVEGSLLSIFHRWILYGINGDHWWKWYTFGYYWLFQCWSWVGVMDECLWIFCSFVCRTSFFAPIGFLRCQL
jgi:hypothetical protein